MRKIIFFALMLITSNVFSDTVKCVVFAPGRENLESGMNKDVICEEVMASTAGIVIDPVYFDVEVLGSTTYTLTLRVIIAGKEAVKNVNGIFHWRPEGEDFVIY